MIFDQKTTRDSIERKNLHRTTTLIDGFIKGNEKTIDKNVNTIMKTIGKHFDELSALMSTPGPEKRPVFTKIHEEAFIKASGIKLRDVTKAIKDCKKIYEKSRTQNNEFYILISALISYHHNKKTQFKRNEFGKILNMYLALRIYKVAFGAFFKHYNPNPEVMSATIERLDSNRYNLKKHKTVFNTIIYIADSHYENFKDILANPIDDNIIYYVTNIYTRIKLMMKTISNLYYENHEKGIRQGTDSLQAEDSEGETYLTDVENVSTLITINSRKIYMSFISDSVCNPKLLRSVCNKTKVSFSKMTMTINKIIESRDELLEQLIIKMLAHYYISGGSTIKSTRFINSMVDVYSVSNTSDKTIIEIKDLLEELMKKYSKEFLKTNNVGTLSNLKKTLLLYITFFAVESI